MGRVLHVPLMYELTIADNGEIALGPGSRKACDEALEAAKADGSDAIIFVSATTPPDPKYRRVSMGMLATAYLRLRPLDGEVILERARSFSTRGEVEAAVQFVRNYNKEGGEDVERVIFHVKSWHTPRTRMLVQRLFRLHDVSVPFEVRSHPLSLGPNVPSALHTLAREVAAYAHNWWALRKS